MNTTAAAIGAPRGVTSITRRCLKTGAALLVSVLLVAGAYAGAHALAGAYLGAAPSGVSFQLYPGRYAAMLHQAGHRAITGGGAFRSSVQLGPVPDVSGAHTIS